jgi:hypothetical protein
MYQLYQLGGLLGVGIKSRMLLRLRSCRENSGALCVSYATVTSELVSDTRTVEAQLGGAPCHQVYPMWSTNPAIRPEAITRCQNLDPTPPQTLLSCQV